MTSTVGAAENDDMGWQHTLALICSFGSKFFISGAFSAVYTYVAELYPTSVRTFGLSIGSLGAALGTFLAPFVLSSGKIITIMISIHYSLKFGDQSKR